MKLCLNWLRNKSLGELANDPLIVGNVVVHATAQIRERCLIGPDVAISLGCIIEK